MFGLEAPDVGRARVLEVGCSDGANLLPVSELVEPKPGDRVESRVVRFRTVGDISCTSPVESHAATIDDIIAETISARVSERGATRLDDQASEAAMEDRKRQGYF